MGVYSNDGFSVKSGQAPGDILGQTLGQIEGGAGTMLFSFYVPQPGFYPFRLLQEQGGWGAGCEWFTVTPAGKHALINDASQGTNAVYAYLAAGTTPVYVAGVVPVNGATSIGADTDIMAVLVDGNPDQVASVRLWVNGLPASVSTVRSNHVTTARVDRAQAPSLLVPGTNNTVSIVYSDDALPPHSYTNSWQFNVIPVMASHTAPAYYDSPASLTVSCHVEYPADQTMYFLVWQPNLPTGWTVTGARGSGNPQLNDGEIILDGPFPNPVDFSYTLSVPANQSGPQDIGGQALYFLSGMTNTARAPAGPDPLIVNGTHAYVYSNPNCGAAAPSGLVAWWPADLNATDWVRLTNFTAGSTPVFSFTNCGAMSLSRQFYRLRSP